jgi:hypothetical protein
VSDAVVQLDKLRRVLGMLGSEHDGEVLAAARAAEVLRRRMGAQWDELLTPPAATPGRPATEAWSARRPDPDDWRATVAWCRRHHGALSPWEASFLAALAAFPRISPKQQTILAGIVAKCSV